MSYTINTVGESPIRMFRCAPVGNVGVRSSRPWCLSFPIITVILRQTGINRALLSMAGIGHAL